jgi:predicted dehydrogenase
VAVGVGIVGCGRVATSWHVPALARVPGASVVAVADLDAERAARLAAQAGGARSTADYHDLLDDPQVDLIAVCVPVAGHAEVAVAALEAGKHVLVEKPLAATMDECERIVAAADSAPGKAAVGFNQREFVLARQAREARRAGRLGEIKLLRTTDTSGTGPGDGPSWRRSRALGGGVLIEHAIHNFDLWRFLLDDEIEEVFALQSGEDETATITARSARGTLIVAAVSDATAATKELEMCGTRERLRVSCLRFDGIEFQPRDQVPGAPTARLRQAAHLPGRLPGALRELRLGGGFAATYVSQWRRLIGGVREDGPVECSVVDGLRAVGILLAVLESTVSGQSVTVAQAAREPAQL